MRAGQGRYCCDHPPIPAAQSGRTTGARFPSALAQTSFGAKRDLPIIIPERLPRRTAFGIHYRGLQGLDGRWQRWRICLVAVAAAEPTDVKG
jgi:hypothetical protein